jgi:hypothetical protein
VTSSQPCQVGTSCQDCGADLTFDKIDDKHAVLIARLTWQLRGYLPEPVDETWGRLRHLGTRRAQLLDEHVACVQQLRDLLECVWPAGHDCRDPTVQVDHLGCGADRDPAPRRR